MVIFHCYVSSPEGTRPLPAFVESFPMVLQREKLCSGRKKKEATWWFIPVSKWVLTPEIASGSLT